MGQYERLLRRLYAVRLLRVAKRWMKYREVEELLGIDATLLARYIAGHVIPSPRQADRIIEELERVVDVSRIIRDQIRMYSGYIDLAPILSDMDLLFIVSFRLAQEYDSEKPTRVVVPETSGISLATLIASILDAGLVIARRRKENPLASYYERSLILPPNIRRIFYVRRDLLGRGDRVLIVDDIVHTGYTLRVINDLIREAGAVIVGVASVVVVGDRWRSAIGEEVEVRSLVRL